MTRYTNQCNHEFIGYSQCCYCGAFKNSKGEIIDKRVRSNRDMLRNEFIEWHNSVVDKTGEHPLPEQIFYWFEKKINNTSRNW